jgi:hypothetical protein
MFDARLGDPNYPLDGKTKIMYDTYAKQDKYVSFANSAAPPGASGALHWLRATYTAMVDAMPTRFEKVAGTANAYRLRNVWPAFCPGGACPASYTGYWCGVAQNKSVGDYQFIETSCAAADALQLRVVEDGAGSGAYVMATLAVRPLYVSYCDGGCGGGLWLAASYPSKADAMTLRLTDPGVAPPPAPPGPPSCVQNGSEPYVCQYGGSWLGAPPLGWNSSWDGFNPMCPGGLPPKWKGASCTNGLGNVPRGRACKWPLTYDGATYNDCISTGQGGYGWCVPEGFAPGGGYNGSWGGCKACDDSHFWDGCTHFPPTDQNGWMLSGMNPEAIHQFSPEEVPVHIALAQEFALFDRWHASPA